MASEKDLSEKTRALWLKALSAVELRNYGYAISLIQAVLKETPGFVEARRMTGSSAPSNDGTSPPRRYKHFSPNGCKRTV